MGPGGTGRRDDDRRGDDRGALGRAGEDLAAAWYEAQGYEVLARNWRCRAGELDIVARRDRLHVFCEVKSRSSSAFGVPAEAVGPAKSARLRRLAALWFAAQTSARPGAAGGAGANAGAGWGGLGRGGPVRFDVACVLGGALDVIEGAL
jgi:putative endonuclease